MTKSIVAGPRRFWGVDSDEDGVALRFLNRLDIGPAETGGGRDVRVRAFTCRPHRAFYDGSRRYTETSYGPAAVSLPSP